MSLLSKGLSRVSSSTTVQKHQFFGTQSSLWSNSHICAWLLEKSELWLYRTLSAKCVSVFNTLSWFVIIFLPKHKHLSISWIQSPSVVILDLKKIKSVTVFIVSSSTCHEVMWTAVYEVTQSRTQWSDLAAAAAAMGPHPMIFIFWMLSFKYNLSHYQHPSPKRFVCCKWPILTHQKHPRSIVYIRVQSWWCTIYEFGQML